ncbi:MAG: Crp/Fnr family transcriptional regulator [Bacteroidota bacterium]
MQFIEFYNHVLKVEISSYDELPYPVQKVEFKKGEIITTYGQIEGFVYFLNSGIAEMSIKSYVSEKMIDFFFENQMFAALTSFLRQQPSDVEIVALTDCFAERIAYGDLMKSYNTSLQANQLARIITEGAYLDKAKREKDFLAKTAEERYQDMFKTHSQYISHIPVNKIAKYLGIHPESLSRIRKKMNS